MLMRLFWLGPEISTTAGLYKMLSMGTVIESGLAGPLALEL